MRSVELLVVLRLAEWPASKWTYKELAESLYLGEGHTHGAVQGAGACRLYDLRRKRVLYSNLMEFLDHGVKYAFAAEPAGQPAVGVRTAADAEPLRSLLVAGKKPPFVWDAKEYGDVSGIGIVPLHRVVPKVAIDDRRFHELLALVDVLRLNQSARHANLAISLLRERFQL